MSTTEAPAAPDLSSLPKRQQLNIAVAQTQEYRWQRRTDAWVLIHTQYLSSAFRAYDSGRFRETHLAGNRLPDYAGDPAAWGALMEREEVWAEPEYDETFLRLSGWCGQTPPDIEGTNFHGYSLWFADSIGEAVCAAVLLKHGIDPTPYFGD